MLFRSLLGIFWGKFLGSFRKDKTRGEASDNSNNSDGSRRKLIELNIRKCYHGDESKLPCGCGDCAAPKLLADCARKGWKPVAIAETWMGPNVKRGLHCRRLGAPQLLAICFVHICGVCSVHMNQPMVLCCELMDLS